MDEKINLDNAYTPNCTVCFKPANGGGGHVHKDGHKILARQCNEHNIGIGVHRPVDPDCPGCYGEWKEEMGLKSPAFMVGYIDSGGFHALDDDQS